MEFLIELIIDILFDSSVEASKNKKVPKWIRYLLISVIILVSLIIVLGVFLLGILFLKDNIFIGVFIIIVGIFLAGGGIYKFRRICIDKKINNNNTNEV